MLITAERDGDFGLRAKPALGVQTIVSVDGAILAIVCRVKGLVDSTGALKIMEKAGQQTWNHSPPRIVINERAYVRCFSGEEITCRRCN
jgi:hypothetical protein